MDRQKTQNESQIRAVSVMEQTELPTEPGRLETEFAVMY